MDLAKTDRAPLEIIAHESAVTCLALNIQGTRLATAGERGTLIRIFDTNDGAKVAELRRGSHHVRIDHSLKSGDCFKTKRKKEKKNQSEPIESLFSGQNILHQF